MKEAEKKAIIKLLEDAENSKFYGEIKFKFRDGCVCQIAKDQSLMLEDLIDA